MAGRHPEFGSWRPTLGKIARIEVGGKRVSEGEFLQVIRKNHDFNQLKRQLEDEDQTKLAILTYFCENNGPKRFMEVLGEIERRENGRDILLLALQESRTCMGVNEFKGRGRFSQLKGRFAESFIADCLNFMFQGKGLRVLTPREVEEFLQPLLPRRFPIDSILLRVKPTRTEVIGVGEYKALKPNYPSSSRMRNDILSKLKFGENLRDFLLSNGREFWSVLGQNLPAGLSREIKIASSKNFLFYWVVAKGPTRGRQTLEKKNVKILQIPFIVGELDKMTLVLLRNYCRARQIIM